MPITSATAGTTHVVRVTINGVERHAQVETRRLLADFLREDLGLTGTHLGCEHGICGACTVLLDGQLVRSCLTFAVQLDGCTIWTVEGLADNGSLSPLQKAFQEHHGVQCGFCTPGMLITAARFLKDHPQPGEEEIRLAISGNLCRCTGYQGIVRAIACAAEKYRQGAVEPLLEKL